MLARMESDDAADLINGLDEERREPIVGFCPPCSGVASARCSATTRRPPAG